MSSDSDTTPLYLRLAQSSLGLGDYNFEDVSNGVHSSQSTGGSHVSRRRPPHAGLLGTMPGRGEGQHDGVPPTLLAPLEPRGGSPQVDDGSLELTGPQSRRGFHCVARALLLTYPRTSWECSERIRRKCDSTRHVHQVVGFELHEDGTQHIHVACFSDDSTRVDNSRSWDIVEPTGAEVRHPNVRMVSRPPYAVRYVVKSGHFEIHTASALWRQTFENWIAGQNTDRPDIPRVRRGTGTSLSSALGKRLLGGEPLSTIVAEQPGLILLRNLDTIRRNLLIVRKPGEHDARTIETLQVGPYTHHYKASIALRSCDGTVDGRKNTHVFIHGPRETGKSFCLKALESGDTRVYRRNRFGNWANYDSNEFDVIVSDDFDRASVPDDAMGELLQCLDGKPTNPNNKGGVAHHRSPKLFIFISNFGPTVLNNTTQWDAFFSRMTCYEFQSGPNRQHPWQGAIVTRQE